MHSRRTLLALAAGTAAILAGCGGSGDEAAVESTAGTLSVAVAEDARPGEYELPVEVRTDDSHETPSSVAVSISSSS